MYSKIFLLFMGIALSFTFSGCGGKSPKVANKVIYKSVTQVYIDSNIPVDSYISKNIQDECSLDTRLLGSLTKLANSSGIKTVTNKQENSAQNILKLEILDAVSSGNAFTGHKKFVVAKGELYEGSKKIASFKVARTSSGGFFGAYKSSCAVLGGCTTSISKDIVAWLKAPIDNAVLGDRYLLRNR